MLAVSCVSQSTTDPLSGLRIGEVPEPGTPGGTEVPDGWSVVTLKAATLNHHDLWSLRGVGLPPERLPMVLGTDAAAVTDDGTPVIVHAVLPSPGWTGEETLDPKRSLFSEVHQGLMSERIAVPTANLVPAPEGLSPEQAACLPTAWLTAYRMIVANSGVAPGGLVLVQGAGGGVASACVALASAMGIRVWATSRSEAKREAALELGAERAFEPGARLPEKVDAVLDSVGAAVWSHSINVLRPGGTLVTCGATSGDNPDRTELTKIFFRQLRVVGSTMGSRDELRHLVSFMAARGVRPVVDEVYPLSQARTAFERLEGGDVVGKLVLVPDNA